MLELISNNYELLFYLALGLMLFGSILGFVGNSKLTTGEDVNNSKSTIVMRLLLFVILIGGLITYYSSVLVDYKNTILLMLFLVMIVFAIMEVRLVFSRNYSSSVKILLILMNIVMVIAFAMLIASAEGRSVMKANKRALNDSAQVQVQDYGNHRS